jgi:hypothetical protein
MELSVPPTPLPFPPPSGILWEMREVAVIVLAATFIDAATGNHVARQIDELIGADAAGAQWEMASLALVPLSYGFFRGVGSFVCRVAARRLDR